jgi:hypothetical protein
VYDSSTQLGNLQPLPSSRLYVIISFIKSMLYALYQLQFWRVKT